MTVEVTEGNAPVVEVYLENEDVPAVEVYAPSIPGAQGEDGEPGADGEDGREVLLRVSGGFIQWQYDGDVSWADLVALSTLQGPPGTDGTNGTNGTDGADGSDGADGADGREVELRESGGFVQWRYVGDVSWTNLLPLADITGPKGDDGSDGEPGTDGTDGTDGDPGADGADGIGWTDGTSGLPDASGWPVGTFALAADGTVYTVQLDGDDNHFWGNRINLTGPAGTNGTNGTDGTDGTDGDKGDKGDDGDPGPGLAAGGTTGQLAAKASDSDYDTEWVDAPDGGGYRGSWSSGTYPAGAIVLYDPDGSVWGTAVETTDEPEHGGDWFRITEGSGFFGAGFVGDFDPGVDLYFRGSIAVFESNLYGTSGGAVGSDGDPATNTTDWELLSFGGGGGSGTVESIVEGANITVDDTDPANPIVSVSGLGTAATHAATDFDASGAAAAAVAGLAPVASPSFTGNPTAPTPATSDNDTSVATTAYVKAQPFAPLASPGLTGNPTAPTPSAGDNDTSIATTAFVQGELKARFAAFKVAGTLTTGNGATKIYNDTGKDWTIIGVRATVETGPTGGTVVVDVDKNGTTVFTNQAHRPVIADGTTTAKVTTIDVPTISDGDYLTVDIDTTTAPAANLTVEITYK